MTDNPIERLRNLLSPYLNLVSVLTLDQVTIEAVNPTLTKLIENDLKVCAENMPLIRQYLDVADELRVMNFMELRDQLTRHLASLSREDMEKWLEMDRKRMEGK